MGWSFLFGAVIVASVYVVAIDWYDQTYPSLPGQFWFVEPKTVLASIKARVKACGPNVMCQAAVKATFAVLEAVFVGVVIVYTVTVFVLATLGQPLIIPLEVVLDINAHVKPAEDYVQLTFSAVMWLCVWAVSLCK